MKKHKNSTNSGPSLSKRLSGIMKILGYFHRLINYGIGLVGLIQHLSSLIHTLNKVWALRRRNWELFWPTATPLLRGSRVPISLKGNTRLNGLFNIMLLTKFRLIGPFTVKEWPRCRFYVVLPKKREVGFLTMPRVLILKQNASPQDMSEKKHTLRLPMLLALRLDQMALKHHMRSSTSSIIPMSYVGLGR